MAGTADPGWGGKVEVRADKSGNISGRIIRRLPKRMRGRNGRRRRCPQRRAVRKIARRRRSGRGSVRRRLRGRLPVRFRFYRWGAWCQGRGKNMARRTTFSFQTYSAIWERRRASSRQSSPCPCARKLSPRKRQIKQGTGPI
jgi:hypothetical protein